MTTATLNAGENRRIQLAADRLAGMLVAVGNMAGQTLHTIRERLLQVLRALTQFLKSLFKGRDAGEGHEMADQSPKAPEAMKFSGNEQDKTSNAPSQPAAADPGPMPATMPATGSHDVATTLASQACAADPVAEGPKDPVDQAIETMEAAVERATLLIQQLGAEHDPQSVMGILHTVAEEKIQQHVIQLATMMANLDEEVSQLSAGVQMDRADVLKLLISSTPSDIEHLKNAWAQAGDATNRINRLRIDLTALRARILAAQGLVLACAADLNGQSQKAATTWVQQFPSPLGTNENQDPLDYLLRNPKGSHPDESSAPADSPRRPG